MAEVDPRAGGEWYSGGLRFRCTQCGNCCTGPPGTVWFTEEEGWRIAEHLHLDEQTFYAQYAHRIGGRWSLTEHCTSSGYDCIFLDRTSVPGKALCSIYPARPAQCRAWPFWPENLGSRRSWEAARRRTPCPGMDQGRLVPIESIRILRDGAG